MSIDDELIKSNQSKFRWSLLTFSSFGRMKGFGYWLEKYKDRLPVEMMEVYQENLKELEKQIATIIVQDEK